RKLQPRDRSPRPGAEPVPRGGHEQGERADFEGGQGHERLRPRRPGYEKHSDNPDAGSDHRTAQERHVRVGARSLDRLRGHPPSPASLGESFSERVTAAAAAIQPPGATLPTVFFLLVFPRAPAYTPLSSCDG